MSKGELALIIYTLLSFTAAGYVGASYSWNWVIVMLSAGLGFGVLSLLVYARRLMYIAAASPHAGFFAAMMSVPLSYSLGGSRIVYMTVIALGLVYFAAFLTYKGFDPDEATSIFVSLSASGGVISAYLILTKYPSASQVWASIIGDPLLVSSRDAYAALIVTLFLVIMGVLSAREIVYTGLDPEDARLSGLKVWVYELLVYSFIGLIVVVMVSIVGFVLEHVLILLPGVIAAYSTKGLYKSIMYSATIAVNSTMLGLYLASLTNTSPSGISGLVLFIVFLATVYYKNRRG